MLGYRCNWCGYVNSNVRINSQGNFRCEWCGVTMNTNECELGYKI